MSEPVRVRLVLSYEGTDFHGWQVQPGRPTIQQAVSDALRAVLGMPVPIHGSGRTDAGVHAEGQVAHACLPRSLPWASLQKAVNAHLPPSIRLVELTEAPVRFHARHDAIGKLYRYRIYRPSVCPPFVRRYVLHYPYPLCEAAMFEVAGDFAGEHDFRAFATAPQGCEMPESTLRTLTLSSLRREGDELVYEVYGRGFLRHMIRNIVGFLLAVGRGNRSRADLAGAFAARSRQAAAATAPARGLVLVRVDYPNEPIL